MAVDGFELAYDRTGSGPGTAPTTGTAAAQARSIADLITGLGLDRPVVFGCAIAEEILAAV